MKSIIKYFIKYPVLGNVLIFAMLLFGLIGYMTMRTTFFPPQPSRNIIIEATYPGASPQEIEEAIVLKIEDNLKGVTGIDRTTSTSKENYARIRVEILSKYDVDFVIEDVKNAVNKINSFPATMEPAVIYKEEPREFAINFAIYGDVSLKALKKQARIIERDLLNKNGVSKLALNGFPDEEIEIAFNEDNLRKYGITFIQAMAAVRQENVLTTGGKIKTSDEEMLIRANLRGYYAAEIKNIILKATPDGTIIKLKDVAEVSDKWSENPNRVYYNGKPAVEVVVSTTNEEDLFENSRIVREYIEKYNSQKSEIKLDVLRDGSEIVGQRRDILESNGIMGMLLVVLFLALFLNTRIAFWVAIAIPLSFLGMFAIAPIYGMTINVMSLLAMILVIGILVDDGVVIAENIYQHYERGKNPFDAAVDGTMEVIPSVISAVLTTIIAFSAFFFIEGALGDRAVDMSFVVLGTLLFSLVEGIFILPAHIAHSKALHTDGKNRNRVEVAMENFLFKIRDKYYAPVLRFAINHTTMAISFAVGLMLITIGAMSGGIIKSTFFPILEFDNVNVTLELAPGSRDTEVDSLLNFMEKRVWEANQKLKEERPDNKDVVLAVTRKIGPGTHQGNMSITLLEGETRNISIINMNNIFREGFGEIKEAEKLTFGMRSIFGKPVSVALVGGNLDDIHEAKNELKEELKKLESLKDVTDNNPPGLREVELSLKEKAYALGLNTKMVMDQVRQGFFGGEAQRILRGIDEIKIWTRYSEEDRSSLSKLEDMRIRTTAGEFPLIEIANIKLTRGILSINHLNGQRQVTVEADIATASTSVTDILEHIKINVLPDISKKYPNIEFDFEGQSRESTKTSATMKDVIPTLLVFMFIIVVFTFRSFVQAAIIFLLIPFSIVGAAWGHFIQGYILSILSAFGIIALAGVIINDSLVLVNAVNRNLKNGMPFKEAVFEGGRSRFRAVILTSITTIAGLGPLIFETSFQAQFLSPMAISLAYGLLWGTILTLLVLPSLLVLANKTKRFIYWPFKGEKPSPEEIEPAVIEEGEV